MTILKENTKTGLRCGVNDYGELFLGCGGGNGYNLPDTPKNRDCVMADFDRYNNPSMRNVC